MDHDDIIAKLTVFFRSDDITWRLKADETYDEKDLIAFFLADYAYSEKKARS